MTALSDDCAVIQHAIEDVPNRSTGYCTDDVSRALVAVLMRLQFVDREDATATRLANTYLAFLFDAQNSDGRFHNFMDYDRAWLDAIGTQDSNGRAIWALGYAATHAPRESWRRLCGRMLLRTLEPAAHFEYPRPAAYAIIGLSHALGDATLARPVRTLVRHCADMLLALYREHADGGWPWFEPQMTYDNARLCEALVRAGLALGDAGCVETGIRTFDFLTKVTVEGDLFVPIGNAGWYPRGGARARFAQQPLEAAAMVDAALAAFDATGSNRYLALAQLAFGWFHGQNLLGAPLAAESGGCSDGLEEHGPSTNLGAESTISYLLAAYAVAARPTPVPDLT